MAKCAVVVPAAKEAANPAKVAKVATVLATRLANVQTNGEPKIRVGGATAAAVGKIETKTSLGTLGVYLKRHELSLGLSPGPLCCSRREARRCE